MSKRKILKYLNEARATEVGLVRVLQSQIAMTPQGEYRTALERHLRETRQHAARIARRIDELGAGPAIVPTAIGAAETALAQGLAIGKLPLDLVRGRGGAEKVLKNAKDAAATEALEIATYTALERLARAVGDDGTARLAASIRADEERMLATILDQIPALTDAMLGGRYEVASTGAGETVRRTAEKTATRAKKTARRAPGAARAAGAAQGAVAAPEDLPIARYDTLNVQQISERLPALSQTDLGKVEAYERRHDNRSTVTDRIAALRAREPWPGYDDQTADEVASVLRSADEDDGRRAAAREYERAHKNRSTVLEVV
jgi:ferritin-like metal-binding protein YciE